MRRFFYYYPFTALGTIVFVAGFVLAITGSAERDAYHITLGLLAMGVPALLAGAARLQARRFAAEEVQWDASAPLAAQALGRGGSRTVAVRLSRTPVWFFFRVRCAVGGPYSTGRSFRFAFHNETNTPSGGRVEVPVRVPLTGSIEARRTTEVRDLFGLTRARFGPEERSAQQVLPPVAAFQSPPPVDASTGERETARTKTPDEQRYYMREYIPGDRFRDINWKASARVMTLITRISPETQEEARTLTVHIRHFQEDEGESLERSAHLDYITGWAISVMRTLRTERPGFRFRVVTARGIDEIESEEDLDLFAHAAAELSFAYEPSSVAAPDPAARTLLVFTTPFDTALDGFLSRAQQAEAMVFTTRLGRNTDSSRAGSPGGRGAWAGILRRERRRAGRRISRAGTARDRSRGHSDSGSASNTYAGRVNEAYGEDAQGVDTSDMAYVTILPELFPVRPFRVREDPERFPPHAPRPGAPIAQAVALYTDFRWVSPESRDRHR